MCKLSVNHLSWVGTGGGPKGSLFICQMQYPCIEREWWKHSSQLHQEEGCQKRWTGLPEGFLVAEGKRYLSARLMDFRSRYPNTLEISCVATLQNPSIVFCSWISPCTLNIILRGYQAVPSLVLNTFIQIFRKMQYIMRSIISPLDKKQKFTFIEKTLEDKYCLLVRMESSEGYVKVLGLCVLNQYVALGFTASNCFSWTQVM